MNESKLLSADMSTTAGRVMNSVDPFIPDFFVVIFPLTIVDIITKTRLFKYTENCTTKNVKIFR